MVRLENFRLATVYLLFSIQVCFSAAVSRPSHRIINIHNYYNYYEILCCHCGLITLSTAPTPTTSVAPEPAAADAVATATDCCEVCLV